MKTTMMKKNKMVRLLCVYTWSSIVLEISTYFIDDDNEEEEQDGKPQTKLAHLVNCFLLTPIFCF
jgi:hypothetical protein